MSGKACAQRFRFALRIGESYGYQCPKYTNIGVDRISNEAVLYVIETRLLDLCLEGEVWLSQEMPN